MNQTQAATLRAFDGFAASIAELHSISAHRRSGVVEEIASTSTYAHTREELNAGARLAWRNHARCNGRMHWRSLHVRDVRSVDSSEGVFIECLNHLRYSTNGGALRAVLSVFSPAQPDHPAFRLLNPQLIRYAGYRTRDGQVLGDPLHLDITDVALALGWTPTRTAFDVLPLIILGPRDELSLWEIPNDAVHEVEIEHPGYPAVHDLGLRWHANPAVSDKVLEIGGIRYPLAPFSGWYVSSEIGARNLSDETRYNVLPAMAQALGLDTSKPSTFWKDRAIVELTYAVHWSFVNAGVHIVDHHTASHQFLEHVRREAFVGRQVPTDWSWVNPPISASTTPTFHASFAAPDLSLRPNFIGRSELVEEVMQRVGVTKSGVGARSSALGFRA